MRVGATIFVWQMFKEHCLAINHLILLCGKRNIEFSSVGKIKSSKRSNTKIKRNLVAQETLGGTHLL